LQRQFRGSYANLTLLTPIVPLPFLFELARFAIRFLWRSGGGGS
jgi:hypothetical protein